jgi:hypothetical protein
MSGFITAQTYSLIITPSALVMYLSRNESWQSVIGHQPKKLQHQQIKTCASMPSDMRLNPAWKF